MAIVEKPTKRGLTATPCGRLPTRMQTLFVTGEHRSGAWLAEALAADSATVVLLEEAQGAGAGLERMREQIFDAVLVSHEPGELDALELVEGMRGSGAEEPIIILGTAGEGEMAALCYEVGADAYLCVDTATTRTLLWTVARAIEHHKLVCDSRRLAQSEKHRQAQEQLEAERLLDEQRLMLGNLDSKSSSQMVLGTALTGHYRELLRAQVIMGSGNLHDELSRLAEVLLAAQASAQQVLRLHVETLEELIRGLGNRSARHVMTRADLLLVETLLHLTAGYRDAVCECD